MIRKYNGHSHQFIFLVCLIIVYVICSIGCGGKYKITEFKNDKGIVQAIWLDNNRVVIEEAPNSGAEMIKGDCQLFIKSINSPSKNEFLYSEKNYNEIHLEKYITEEQSIIYTGERIYIGRNGKDNNQELNFYKINVINKPPNPTLLYTLNNVWDYTISNDGKKLAYTISHIIPSNPRRYISNLYVVDLASKKQEFIYTNETTGVTDLVFSPKGDKLAISETYRAQDNVLVSLGYIFLNNPSVIEQLTNQEKDKVFNDILWSKDGNNIYYFESFVTPNLPRGEYPIKKINICNINLNGRKKEIIYQTDNPKIMGLSLSPDEHYLTFIQNGFLNLLKLSN